MGTTNRLRMLGLSVLTGGALAFGAVAASANGSTGARAAERPPCASGEVPRGDGCVSRTVAARKINGIVARTMRSEKLKSALVSVRVGSREVVTSARGTSMTGVPARTNMRFRIGNVAIAYLGTLALLLQEDGVIDLDEPISKYVRGQRDGDRITPRMLLQSTAGNRDFVGYPPFNRAFYDDVFRRFGDRQLYGYVLAQPPACEPGECWRYSHWNYHVIGTVLSRAAGRPLKTLLERRVLKPSGLSRTAAFSTARIPKPVLHSFTRERGVYEDSTFWNPSWTLARGSVMTSTIRDVARSARVMGSGRLLSERSYAEFTAPDTAGLEPWGSDLYYGLGIVSNNSWLTQAPAFAGYFGAMGYLPSREISIAVASTKREAAEPDPNVSNVIMRRISAYMAPGEGLGRVS